MLTSLFVDRPFCCLITGYVLLLILSVIAGAAGLFTLSDGSVRDYMVWTNEMTIAFDKQVAGRDFIKAAQAKGDLPIRLQKAEAWYPSIVINTPSASESLLKKEHLLKIKEMEDKIKNIEKWPKYCLAKSDTDGSCADDAI